MTTDTLYESLIDDGPGRLVVTRSGDRTALFTLWDGETPIYVQRDLPLAYGAIFGPDVGDVALWQDLALERWDEYVAATQPLRIASEGVASDEASRP